MEPQATTARVPVEEATAEFLCSQATSNASYCGLEEDGASATFSSVMELTNCALLAPPLPFQNQELSLGGFELSKPRRMM